MLLLFFSYIVVNGFKLNHKRQIVTSLLQIKNGVDVLVIPISFFYNDKQLLIWVLQTPNEILENHIRSLFEELSGKTLSNHKIKVLRNR
jgi:hypothetical protein